VWTNSAASSRRAGDELLAPLRPQTAGDQVTDRLLTAIALGELSVGERLPPQRELASRMSVSRMSIRKALHTLEQLGMVEVRRGRNGGAYIRQTWSGETSPAAGRILGADRPRVEWLLDMRSLVEGLVAATAALRVTKAQADKIAAALEEYLAADTEEASRSTDRKLHTAIAEATGNPYLVRLSDELTAAVTLGLGVEPIVDDASVTRRARQQHRQLAGAVLEGRPDDARRIAMRHFALTAERVRSLAVRVTPSES
jgi:GntR family transcriptional regulator, transcriptional repressor for pyruvate dehydrogenase complex